MRDAYTTLARAGGPGVTSPFHNAVAISGLSSAKFSPLLATRDLLRREFGLFVLLRGRYVAVTGGDGTSNITIRCCLIDNATVPADGAATGNVLAGKMTWNGADTDTIQVGVGAGAILTQRVVTAATNATPIVITTSVSHGYSTGDRVRVAAVGGNTAANGDWVIVVLSATTFSLVGSVGNANYTSGGTADKFVPFTIEYQFNSQAANAGNSMPIPSEHVSFRSSNSGLSYSGGLLYLDEAEAIG